MPRLELAAIFLIALALASCGTGKVDQSEIIDGVAEDYVKLSLELGLYDPDYVDAYSGPPEWKPAPLDSGSAIEFPREQLVRHADELLARLEAVEADRLDELERRRLRFLTVHIASARARIELVGGMEMSFDEESMALYDVVAPECSVDTLEAALRELENLVPGTGNLAERVEAYRSQFVVPEERIDTVFTAAIAEARKRTIEHIPLPEGESFDVEYVTDASWGAYNWYKGNLRSLIQVNTGLPFRISSPLGLACHEGYPGHHVQNVLVEKNMLIDREWIEYSVQPLFCPQAVLNEGGANYGIEIAFTEEERIAFMRDVLFPLAGLDPSKAEEYYRFEQLTRRLRGATVEAIRSYLDGKMTREEASLWLQRYSLMSAERAERYIRFGEQYRSYVVTYSVGLDMVRISIERESTSSDDPERRWELLRDLYAVPHVPSDLE
jgi:hypothetical protein